MTTDTGTVTIKAGLVALLAAAMVMGPRDSPQLLEWVRLLILGIGVFNVVITVPGTFWIRAVSVAASLFALLVPAARGAVVLLFWLVAPPVYVLAWATAHSRMDEEGYIENAGRANVFSLDRVAASALIAAVAIASLAYKFIFYQQLQQTAALFVGIPALLAIVVVLFVSPRSAKGVACKAVTVGLLVSLFFLGEGALCVLMSAPIFYGVAVGVAAGMSAARRRSDDPVRTLYSSVLVLTILISSLEGISAPFSFARHETVTASKIVRAAAGDIQRAVLEQPKFDRAMPFELRIGFPRPTSVQIADGGSRWTIRMRGGEMRLDGMEPRAGDLVLRLEESRPGLVRWSAVSDNSHMTHFLTWRSAAVAWEAIDANTTRVTWTLQYRPRARPCVVLRAVGAIRGAHRRWLPDRRGGHAMIAADPYLIVRAASIYVTVVLTIAAWLSFEKGSRPLSRAACSRLRGICRSWSSSTTPHSASAGGDSTQRAACCSASPSTSCSRGCGCGA